MKVVSESATERERMVTEQIERRGVRDPRVLAAMRAVPRELFVPPERRMAAYDDRALPIGEEQTISQPYIVALMTEHLGLREDSHVLEVGTGSGYQAAILAAMAGSVVSIERRAELAARARQVFETLGLTNVDVVVGDGTEGYPARAPYDGIIVTAGGPKVPDALREQLAIDGRLVVPVGSSLHQELVIVTRRRDGYEERRGEACVFVPLIGAQGWTDSPRRGSEK
jgi:protein-L-isoaspartate(D-aspartate) O-methyltransferase